VLRRTTLRATAPTLRAFERQEVHPPALVTGNDALGTDGRDAVRSRVAAECGYDMSRPVLSPHIFKVLPQCAETTRCPSAMRAPAMTQSGSRRQAAG
jgi:hypothetical protein